VVYTSTAAVYGGPYPEDSDDDFILQPTTSYGTQKAIGELLLNDYSRRGILDGIGLRLPTICVRPGKPNAAASGVFSNIIREPLVGIETTLAVSKDVSMVFASPRSAVGFLIHAAQLDTSLLGSRRSMMMPGVHATIGDEINALRRVAGEKVVSYIKEAPIDTFAQQMVDAWNFPAFPATRARSLGFTCEKSFDELIHLHIESELDGKIPGQSA
jgi:nucleoside-diphosphate-sugar epimerase